MDNQAYCNDALDTVEKNDGPKGNGKPTEESIRASYSQNSKSTFIQCFVTFVDSLSIMNVGLFLSLPPLVIYEVHDAKVGLSLNDEEISWYASIVPIFQPLGCFLGGYLQNYIGRKYGLVLAYILSLTTWIILYYAASVEVLYVGAAMSGMCIGFIEAPGLVYVCEIATPKLRGLLVTCSINAGMLGGMLTYFLTSIIGWRMMILVDVGLTTFSAIMLVFIPDSPVWLITKGRTKEAIKALQYLRGWACKEDVMPEFQELSQFIDKSYSNDISEGNSTQERSLKMKDLLEKQTLRPFFFLFCSWFFACHCSWLPAHTYMLILFDRLNLPVGSKWLGFWHVIVRPIGSVSWAAAVKIIGKRVSALLSITFTSILSLLMGLCIIYLHEIDLSSIFIGSYILQGLVQINIMNTPFILMGEIFPPKIKALATGLTVGIIYITISVYTKMFYILQPLITPQGTFLIYSVVGFIGIWYIWVFMPETEGKTMAEIEELFFDDARRSCPHFKKKK